MASLDGFDASQVEPSEGFDTLPAGEYRVCIVASERKKTKSGNGELIEMTLQILDGQFQNRKIFERINFVNSNPTAQQIGRGTLSAICRAVGVMTPGDTSELHNRPMRAKVKIVKQEGYNDKNEVTKYSADKVGPAQPAATEPTHPANASAWAQTAG